MIDFCIKSGDRMLKHYPSQIFYFFFPMYSIKYDIPDTIQNIAIIIKAILQPIETSATKIKVYKANILIIKQIIVVIIFAFVCLSILNTPS